MAHLRRAVAVLACAGLLGGCFDNDHPPAGAGGLAGDTRKVMDKAAAVNQTIDAQDAATRKAIDAQDQ